MHGLVHKVEVCVLKIQLPSLYMSYDVFVMQHSERNLENSDRSAQMIKSESCVMINSR